MEPTRINIKLFLREHGGAVLADFVPVFHRWIQEGVLEDTLVDLHDYSHVSDGAGIVLVAFEANYGIDDTEGERGLLYGRKQPMEGSAEDRILAALRATLDACRKLEQEEGLKLRFATDRVRLIVNDRLAAPNTDETLERLRPAIDGAFSKLFGGAAHEVTRERESRRRFGVDVTCADSADLTKLIDRLA